MGQIQEGSNDALTIAKNLIEIIVNEVIKAVNERTESSYESFENLKLQACGNEDILDCLVTKPKNIEKTRGDDIHETQSLNPSFSDICYSDLANLPEVCIHSSSLSNSNKQGEGDYQPHTIREAVAFYSLGLERDQCGLARNQQCKGASSSSLNTETSHNEMLENLHNNIYNLSFDNIHLSDSDADDALPKGFEFLDAINFLGNISSDVQQPDANESVENLQHSQESDNFLLQHSQKFCQVNNKQYFPLCSTLPPNYCELVEESYNKYKQETKEGEEQELTSGSSQELVIIEGEEEVFTSLENLSHTNPFRQTLFSSHNPSTSASSLQCFPDLSPGKKKSTKEMNTIQVVADVEKIKEMHDWEEALEVQVNITEPVRSSETQKFDDNDIIQNRKYWSNVGLINETIVNPKYLGPTDGIGIESIQGMSPVKEQHLTNGPEKVIWVTEPQGLEENESQNSSLDLNADNKVNYLSFSDKTAKEKKKKKFMSRITSAISNMFRSKKKNSVP